MASVQFSLAFQTSHMSSKSTIAPVKYGGFVQ